jgi:NADH dehydrogenase FAD-containing subunit
VPNSSSHAIVQARVLSVQPQYVKLDREWQGSDQIPFEYLTLATGTNLAEPGSMKHDDKVSSVRYLQSHQQRIKDAKSILIVGGGAVGVQMATDLKECNPEKEVILVHSRPHLMPAFHSDIHGIIKNRFDELGVKYVHCPLTIYRKFTSWNANRSMKTNHRLSSGSTIKWLFN